MAQPRDSRRKASGSGSSVPTRKRDRSARKTAAVAGIVYTVGHSTRTTRRTRRAAPGSWRRAGGGRPHHAEVASQCAIQPRCAVALAARREDWLPAPESPGRATSRAARLHQPRLAQRLLPRLRGLHAEPGLRQRPRAPRAARGPVPDGDHVCRGRAMAVPPIADRGRSHGSPMASAPYSESPDRPASQAHSLPQGALRQGPLPGTEGPVGDRRENEEPQPTQRVAERHPAALPGKLAEFGVEWHGGDQMTTCPDLRLPPGLLRYQPLTNAPSLSHTPAVRESSGGWRTMCSVPCFRNTS